MDESTDNLEMIQPPARFSGKQRAGAGLLLACAVLAAHGWSLGDGLALDDHWHYRSVQACAWSLSDLLAATTIDTRDHLDVWWQESPVRFQYARPVAVALLKATYAATGGSVTAPHVVSLILHFAAAALVCRLCLLLTRRPAWSVLGGVLFAAYPLSVFAVSWLAAQNMLLMTVLMLSATLLYARASGLDLGRRMPPGAGGPCLRGALVGVFACWVLALFSRENAIVFPALAVALDWAYGGRRKMWARRYVYLVFAAVGAAYLLWRLRYYYAPMPDVYFSRPAGIEYAGWLLAKLLHYVCCAVWPAPMAVGPTGRYQPFTEAPGDCLLMAAIVLSVVGLYAVRTRRLAGWWVWPVWILLSVLPVLPVLATPHSGYVCGVAVAVGLTLALAPRVGRGGRSRGAIAVAAIVLMVYAGSAKVARLMWKGVAYAEQCTVDDMRFDPPPESASDVFLINLPFTGIYAKQCLLASHGARMDAIDWHVLTFAPHLVRMDRGCVLEPLDDHSLMLTITGRPYFSGLLGRFLIDGFGREDTLREGDSFVDAAFTAEVLEVDAEGVRRLRFTFPHRLDDPRYCFYITSPECGALRLTFRDIAEPAPMPAVAVATRVETTIALAEALGAPVEDLFAVDAAPDAGEAAEAWWAANVDDRVLRAVFHDISARRDLRHRRDELQRGRALAARYLRTDLYLTGDPFPGPR